VTGQRGVPRRLMFAWLSAWPIWSFVMFASLAAVHLLPGGYIRTVLAAPILLLVPGSLTLGAVLGARSPRGVVFVCYSALLGAVWSIFASLALYVDGVLITAATTYWCLLILSALLAIVAEARLLLGRPGRGRRVAGQPDSREVDLSHTEIYDPETQAVAKRGGYHAFVALAAGATLLGAGLYTYDHLPRPAPTGYTWIAWTGQQVKNGVVVSSPGTKLAFRIVHHQSDTTNFRLTAAWLGTRTQPLAKSLAFSIGPGKTFQGALVVPPIPNGCTYRIVVTLTAIRQIDPMNKKPETWSINADVRDPGKSLKACK
jgi:hypothetical protein